MQIDHLRDLAQGQLFVIVEAEHGALDLRNTVDAGRQKALQLGPFQKRGRQILSGIRDVLQQVLALFAPGILQARYIQAADLDQPSVVLLERDSEFPGDLVFGGRTLQLLLGGGDRLLNLFGLAAFLAGRPIQAAEAIQNRSANLVLRISLELDVMGRVEMVDGGNEPEHSRGHQVVQTDALRQPFLYPPRDETYLRQVLEDEFLAPLFRDRLAN